MRMEGRGDRRGIKTGGGLNNANTENENNNHISQKTCVEYQHRKRDSVSEPNKSQ